MIEMYFRVEGPNEERIVSLIEQIKAALADNSNVESEIAEVRAVVDGYREANGRLEAKIADLQIALEAGGGVTQADLVQILELANAKNAAIASIFTPEPTAQPSGPGE